MWSAALDKSDLLLSYCLVSLATHITNILISTVFYLVNIPIYCRLSKSLMEDWTGKASARLQCEQAAKALRAQAVIKHSIMASKQ